MDSQGGDPRRPAPTRRIPERVADLGRTPSAAERPLTQARAPAAEDPGDLRSRVERLERALEALQDQVHRESKRHDDELAELRHSLRPGEIARSLSEDARRRGL
jgi:hypothetical protein